MVKSFRVPLHIIRNIAKKHTPEVDHIEYAPDSSGKKYTAYVGDKKYNFGALGYADYLTHKDKKRREQYYHRHKGMNENWNHPSPGRYSAFLLWKLYK